MDFQRKLLEELMNPLLGTQKDFKDADVCKYNLVSFCPHDLFTNTKFDLGACPYKNHDEKLAKTYQSSPEKGRLGYESEFASVLSKLVNEMDRNIRKAKERLELTAGADLPTEDEGEKEERIVQVEEEIKTLTAQMEEYGEQGEVEKAQELLAKVDQLKQNIDAIRASSGTRKLVICEVCSASLVQGDLSARMDSHLVGKQHTGYLKMRQWLEGWKSTQNLSRSQTDAPRGGGGLVREHRDSGGYRNDRRPHDERPYDRDRGDYHRGGGGGGSRQDYSGRSSRDHDYDRRRNSGGGGGGSDRSRMEYDSDRYSSKHREVDYSSRTDQHHDYHQSQSRPHPHPPPHQQHHHAESGSEHTNGSHALNRQPYPPQEQPPAAADYSHRDRSRRDDRDDRMYHDNGREEHYDKARHDSGRANYKDRESHHHDPRYRERSPTSRR